MKILHVVPTYLPARRYGGPVVAVHGLCKALAARGHDVDVFTTNVDGPGTLDVPIDEPVALDGVNIRYFTVQYPRLYWSRGMGAAFDKSVGGYDVVHIHSVYLWPGVAAARAARRAGIPYVVSPRGMLVPELIAQKNRLVKTVWLWLVERRGLAHAAAIHFTSSREWDDARRIGVPLPAPFVVPNGIEPGPRPNVEREANTLLFLGRLSWKKGLERVIEGLPAGARLLIAGNDEENMTSSLRDLAVQAGVSERVEFLGPVYGEAKDRLLARATLFVLLSQSENFGNAVLEALAMETPVVLSAEVGVAPDVIAADAGVIGIDEGAALLADPARRLVMGKNGRHLVESRFGWQRIASEMEQRYSALR